MTETRRSRLPRWLRVVLAAGAFAGFGIGGLLISVFVLAPLYLLPGARIRRSQRVVAFAFRVFHAYMRWTGLVDYRPVPLPHPSGPLVVVSNHPTLVDVTAIVAALPELCVVVRGSIFTNPLLRLVMVTTGYIQARSGLGGAVETWEEADRRLAAGHSVLIFPEGTRSPRGGIHPFHRGAFALAARRGASVLPLLVRVDCPLLEKGRPWHDLPVGAARLTVEALPVVDGDDPSTLREQVQRHYEQWVGPVTKAERPSATGKA